MPDKKSELLHLEQSEKKIASTERRIEALREEIKRLEASGMDTAPSEEFLEVLLETASVLRRNKALALQRLDGLGHNNAGHITKRSTSKGS